MLLSYLDSELGYQFSSRVFQLRAHILGLVLPLASHVMLGELPNLSVYQFHHKENEDCNNTCFIDML